MSINYRGLELENNKLREALEKIVNFGQDSVIYDWSDAVSMAQIAKEALDNGC